MTENLQKIINVYNNMPLFIPDYYEKNIYHYTSSIGFKGIIENTSLRFSDRNFLNDSSEGSYVLDLAYNNIDFICKSLTTNKILELKNKIKIRKEDLINERFHTYQCSFSVKNDNLSLWNYYTKGDSIKGYSLKFDIKKLMYSITPKTENLNEKVLKPLAGKVVYNRTKQLDILKNIIETFGPFIDEERFKDTINDLLIDKILLNGKFFKMPCFSVEKEFRIVYETMIISDTIFKGIPKEEMFRELNGYFIPYIEKKFSPDSLLEVIMSPTLDTDLTKASLNRILRKNYPNTSINKSEIPVRY